MAGYGRMTIMSMSEEEIKRVLTEERDTLSDYTAFMMVEELKRREEQGEQALPTAEELEESKNAISLLGAECENVINYTLTNGVESLERTMVIIRKQTHTPQKYPRNNSQISKKPL